ncbi:MAG: hypothetical protein IJV22_10090 [Bacteroidales bacterium]|nr:hypothetical protein [Bacteroidales bacterium]MBQ9639887.1 hypothetical protein [Bacteroidales bacterium]
MRLPWHGIQPPAADLPSIRKKLIDHGRFFNRPRSVLQSTTVSSSIDHGQFLNRPRSVPQSTTVGSSIDHGRFLNRPRSVFIGYVHGVAPKAMHHIEAYSLYHISSTPRLPPMEAPRAW